MQEQPQDEDDLERWIQEAMCDALNEAEHGPNWERQLRRDLEESEAEEVEQEVREARRNAVAWRERGLLAASREKPADEPGDEDRA